MTQLYNQWQTLPRLLPELKVISDMLGLTFLDHIGPITWGISCHFTFSSRVELLTRKARGKRKSPWHPQLKGAFWVLRRWHLNTWRVLESLNNSTAVWLLSCASTLHLGLRDMPFNLLLESREQIDYFKLATYLPFKIIILLSSHRALQTVFRQGKCIQESSGIGFCFKFRFVFFLGRERELQRETCYHKEKSSTNVIWLKATYGLWEVSWEHRVMSEHRASCVWPLSTCSTVA